MAESGSYPPPGPGDRPVAGGPPPPGYAAPPPGYAAPPPGYAPPGYGAQPPGPVPRPGPAFAAHKPGAVPLRPLGVGDIYDATFKIIRFNPTATVGSAVLVASIAMALPILITSAFTATVDMTLEPTPGDDLSVAEVVGLFGSMGSLIAGSVLMSFGLILVTGMIAHVTLAAALGRRLTLGEAWAATHGKRWRLIAMMVLMGILSTLLLSIYVVSWIPVVMNFDVGWIVLYGFVSLPLFAAVMFWFWIRVYYLPVPALMLEDTTILGALGRGFELTRSAFWRTFGIALLTFLIAQVASSILSAPFTIFAALAPELFFSGRAGVLVLVVVSAIGSVVAAAFVAPFTSAVVVLQYVDLRIRSEAFDVTLMERAGLTPPAGPTAPPPAADAGARPW